MCPNDFLSAVPKAGIAEIQDRKNKFLAWMVQRPKPDGTDR